MASEVIMTSEIKRNYWSRFCKKFNSANQYRPAVANISPDTGKTRKVRLQPFLGLSLSKKGRVIDGLQLITGCADPQTIAVPGLTIKEPEKIFLEKNENGIDARLKIQSKDGTEIQLELDGSREPMQAASLVEKLAYSIFEKRGHNPGDDKDDWFEAERRVRSVETELTA